MINISRGNISGSFLENNLQYNLDHVAPFTGNPETVNNSTTLIAMRLFAHRIVFENK